LPFVNYLISKLAILLAISTGASQPTHGIFGNQPAQGATGGQPAQGAGAAGSSFFNISSTSISLFNIPLISSSVLMLEPLGQVKYGHSTCRDSVKFLIPSSSLNSARLDKWNVTFFSFKNVAKSSLSISPRFFSSSSV